MNNMGADTQIDFLRYAIEDGDTSKILQILQENDVDVTAVDENEDTMLHLILLQSINFVPRFSPAKIIEMMDIFISRGVDPNVKNKNQVTVLHLAIAGDLKDVVDYLLKCKSNVNVIDENGNSIAHHFIKSWMKRFHSYRHSSFPSICIETEIKKYDSNFVEWLISKGVDFDLTNKDGQSALHLAIEFNMQHILATLFKNTRNVNFVTEFEKQNLLHLFLKTVEYVNHKGDRRGAKRMFSIHPLQSGVLLPSFNYHPILPLFSLHFPSKLAVEIVQILLERGVPINHEDKDGLTPLHLAIRNRVRMPIVLMILDRFVNISDELAVTLVHEIVKNKIFGSPCFDRIKVLDSLTTKVINMNGKDANGKTCLYHAVVYNDLKALELMKRRGALDFNVLTNDGENLLHAVAKEDSLMFTIATSADPDRDIIFDLLMSEGCDVRAKNCKGQTPLHWAARCSNFGVAQKLIAHGADVNCEDLEKQLCPLHEVIINQGSIELVELLLDNGAKANSKSKDGRPLDLAMNNFRGRIMLLTLLKYKAEVNARDPKGDIALAKALRHESDVQGLLVHGADINDASVIRLLPRCIENCVGKILLQHWVKLRTACLSCSDEYQTYVVVNKTYEKLHEDCLREIQIMKGTFIDTLTSLYSWLHMDPNRRYAYNQNEKLRKIVDSPKIKEQFPQYSTVILGNHRDTLTRKMLLEPAKEAWLELTEIHLPDLCIERVFAYLNTGDLFEMSEIINKVDWN